MALKTDSWAADAMARTTDIGRDLLAWSTGMANAHNQEGDKEKIWDGNEKYPGGEEDMGMIRTHSQNGSQPTSKNCTHMGAGR